MQIRRGSRVAVRGPIFSLIKKDFPDFTEGAYISVESLNQYRQQYIEQIINSDNDETTALEKQIIKSLTDHEILSNQLLEKGQVTLTFGQRLSDKIALFGCDSSTYHYDESKPTIGKRPFAGAPRL